MFSSATEDAVLLDAERQQISPDLRLSRNRIDEAVSAVLARLAASEASVTFSYSCRDTREFRETYASWLMLQAFRLQRGDETLSYRDMKAALGEPKSAVPAHRETALSSAGWWLRSVAGTGDDGITVLTAPFASVVDGRAADVQHRSNAFTDFDGYVTGAGLKLDPASPERVFSVTELEKAAECPFRFFLKHGLGVRPVDRGERDKDVWLDHLTRGLKLHDLYAALLRRARDEHRRPREQDRAWLLALAQDNLDRINEEMPAATPEILARESKDFLADVELFLDAELDNPGSKPVGIEVSFGRPLNGDEQDPLARAEPLVIDLGCGIKLRVAGRMDRIDQVGTSSFQVIDYKSGGYYWKKWQGVFDGGRRLQHALYGLAAVELLKSRYSNPEVVRGV